MKIDQLDLKPQTEPKRVGRGISAGGGKTAGRGTKGQNARSGGGVRPGFEGGQNPWVNRIPKRRGFTPRHRVSYQIVSLEQLSQLGAALKNLGSAELLEAGLIKYADRPVKVLGSADLKKPLSLEVQAVTETARAKIESAGGKIKIAELPTKPRKTPPHA